MTAIDRSTRNAALLVAGCFFMETLDGTIVVTAIPQLSSSLHVSAGSAGLLITAYLVTLAVLTPLGGWMAARYGPRRMFATAIVVFTGASLGCGLSTSLAELVILRVLQGAGGAMMVPIGRMVVLERAEKSQIITLMSYVVWPGLLAPVIAPLAGGLITTYASWRWLFLINVPIGLAAFVAARRLIRGGPAPVTPPLDRLGVALICGAIGALTIAAQLVSAPRPSWVAAGALALASAGLAWAAVAHLLSVEAPVIDLRTLEVGTFRAAMMGTAAFWLVVGAIPFLLVLLFQTVFGWSAVKSGEVVLFVFAGNVAIKPATTRILHRFGFRATLVFATCGLAATSAAAGLIGRGTPVALIAVVVFASGVARSIGLTAYTTLALSDVPRAQMRHANALAATVQQLFAGLGVAVATVALRAGGPLAGLLPGEAGPGAAYRVAFMLVALIAVAAGARALRLGADAGRTLMG